MTHKEIRLALLDRGFDIPIIVLRAELVNVKVKTQLERWLGQKPKVGRHAVLPARFMRYAGTVVPPRKLPKRNAVERLRAGWLLVWSLRGAPARIPTRSSFSAQFSHKRA